MPINIDDVFHRKVKNDSAFIVSDVDTVASGGTFTVHLRNPDGSDKTLWLYDIRVSSDGGYIARVHDGFSSAPSNGTPTEIQSMLLDSGAENNDGIAVANTGVSFTANSTHAVGVSGGGGSGVTIGGSNQHASVAIEEGREIVVEVENTSNSENNYGVSIVYYEKDGSELS